MKAGPLLALAAVVSALVASLVLWFVAGTDAENDSLDARGDLRREVKRSHERIATLEDDIDALRSSQERLEALVRQQNETLGLVSALHEEFLEMRMEMARMKDGMPSGGTPSLAALTQGAESPEELEAVLEEALAKAVDSRLGAAASPANQMRAFQPFIRAGFTREMRRMARRLNLKEDQKERFDKTMTEAFDKSMPQVAIMMDTSRSKEEREQAYDEVKTTYDNVGAETASFLDPEQKKTFDAEQERSRGEIDRLRDMIESGGSIFPGMPGAPPPPAGN